MTITIVLPGGSLLPAAAIYSDLCCPAEGSLPSSSRATFPDRSSPLGLLHTLSPLASPLNLLQLGPGICRLPVNHFCLLSLPHPAYCSKRAGANRGPAPGCSPQVAGAQAKQMKQTCALRLHDSGVFLNHHLLAFCHPLSIR